MAKISTDINDLTQKMKGKDDLYRLIKAMSKSEKRYFSIDANKSGKEGAKYLKLFRVINDMETWDNDLLKKKLKTNLSAEKKYLYYAILKSMRDYRSSKSKAAQVKERLMDSEYLYERGLYAQSQEQLAKAKELVIELEDQFMLLKISVDEQQFFAETKKQLYEDEFKDLNLEKEETLVKLSQELKYLDLYIKLAIKVVQEFKLNNQKSIDKLNAEISVDLLTSKNMPDSPRAQRRFFLCNAMYYRLLGEQNKVYDYSARVVEWWDKHLALKTEEFHRYVVDVSNLVNSCYQTGNFLEEAQQYVEKLLREKEGASYQGQKIIFQKVSISNLLHHLNQGDFVAAEAVLPEIIEGMNQFGLKKSIVLVGNIATVYFIVGNYKACLEWCTFLIENLKTGRRKDIYRIMRIYKIICLFELDKIEELDSFRRSVQRYFKLENLTNQNYEVQINDTYLKKIINAPISSLKNEYQQFLNYLNQIKSEVGSDTPLGLDELIIWVKSNL